MVKLKPNALKTISDISHSHSHAHAHDHRHSHVNEESDEDTLSIKPIDVFFPKNQIDPIPFEFNAVRIQLDGKVKSGLCWVQELSIAREYIKLNKKIFWDLDLGLFKSLEHPLDHKAQFLSLCLSLEHFKNTVWKEFRDHTVGLCIFRGSLDFSKDYRWNENQEANLKDWLLDHDINEEKIEGYKKIDPAFSDKSLKNLFCRDSCSEYLRLLADTLPDTIPVYIFLEAKSFYEPYEFAELIDKEKFSNFQVALKDSPYSSSEFTWNETSLNVLMPEGITLGVCLSFTTILKSHFKTELKSVIRNLCTSVKLFRLIPILTLTNEWDGLDDLIVDAEMVDKQLFRKLQGFCAAGGRVVYLGKALKLPSEISFNEWKAMNT